MTQIQNVRTWIETTYGVKLESHAKKAKNPKEADLTQRQLLQYFKNAEPGAASTSINNIISSKASNSEGRDGNMNISEIRGSLPASGTTYLFHPEGWNKPASLSATINSLRQQGINLPQNTDSKEEVIDALEVKAVEGGLRRALINMPKGQTRADANSFNNAKGLNPNNIDKENQYVDGTELILWAQVNAEHTKPFVKAELDALNKELKDAKF